MPAGRAADRGAAPRLRVGVISAGRVGAVLGAALARAGHRVVATSAVSDASRRRAAELVPQAALLPPDEVAEQADLVLLAVPDDVLPGLVRGLVATESLRTGQIVVHTCGAHGVRVLGPAADVGTLPLAMHPAMTFTGRAEDIDRLATACMAVTAPEDESAWNVAEALALELGMEPVRVPEESRPLYHAALAHGANHLITLVNDCAALLRDAGIEPAQRIIAPILSASLDNALRFGDRAITGPVTRGDVGTVRSHLSALRAADPDAVGGYVALAKRTVERSRRAGLLSDDAAAEVRQALDEGSR